MQEIKNSAIPEQEFNGKIYRLYDGEVYFSRGTKRLHRVVWEFYNGAIPDGYSVHHKDENTHNNLPENLELMENKNHLSLHIKKRCVENKDWLKRFSKAGNESSKKWHDSEAGRKWHSDHAKSMNLGNITYGNRICPICNGEFVAQTNSQLFCSNSCKSKNRRDSGVDNVIRVCEYCGIEFITDKYSRSTCCSRKCGKSNSIKKINALSY